MFENKNKLHYESNLLQLDCSKAKKKLKWCSILTINETIEMTINWYKKFYNNSEDVKNLSIAHIKFYEKLMKKRL